MADANLGTATVRTRLDIEGLRSGLSTAGQQIGQFADRSGARLEQLGARFTKLGGALTIGVTTPLVLLGRSFVNAASDAEETASKFETVFRSLGDGAERAADRFAESFGQSSTNARRLLGDTGDLLTGFGFTQAAALDLSVSVNELAVDLASFTNFSGGAEGASQALTKALLGETESLKSLGVAIRQTDVDAKVLELTQQGVTFETERQARAYATLQIAQDQSLNAIGDYARTSDSFANTQRRLANALNELSVSFGTVLLPVATRAAEGLTGVVSALADLPGPAQTAIVVLAGIAAAGGPVILFAGQLITAIPKVTSALVGLRTASLGFLGAGGILALLGVGVATLAQRLIEANPALTAQKDAIEALKDEYAEYRGELVITSDAERAAAIDRLNTLRGEVQARIALLAEIARQEQERAQALIDSPLLQFLLPGFINVRGGARQDTLAEIQGLSETLNRLNLDQFVIQSGANTLVPPPTPPPAAPPPAVPGAPAGTTPPGATSPVAPVLTSDQVVEIIRGQLARLDPDVAARLNAQQGGLIAEGLPQTAAEVFATSDELVQAIVDIELRRIRLRDPLVAARLAAQQGGAPLPSEGPAARPIALPGVTAVADFSRLVSRSGQQLEEVFRGSRVLQTLDTRARLEAIAAEEAEEANRQLQDFSSTLERLAQAGRAASVEAGVIAGVRAAPFAGAFGVNPGRDFQLERRGPGVPLQRDSSNPQVQRNLAEERRKDIEAAEATRDRIVQAGLQFGQSLASAIKSGSPSGIFGALAGGVGGIIGAVNPLAGAIFSTVGGIVSGFLPGASASRQEAARAAGANVRGAPAVELNFVFNQSLSLASLTDPASRQALAQQATDAFQRIERIISTNLVPRLERLEATS